MSRHNDEYKADIANLHGQISDLINAKVSYNISVSNCKKKHMFLQPKKFTQTNFGDENTDPAAQPLFWVSKWVDYSDKYGFGYQLCDEGMGVMFNDTTKLIMLPNGM